MKPSEQLRTLGTTAAAMAAGLVNIATGRVIPSTVELQPGDAAPDFTLPGSDGRTYSLAQFSGVQAVVLAWFPKAFTRGCTAECESIAVSGHELRRFRVAYFAASVDDAETNRRFAASMGIDFPILSDERTTTARAYGVLGASGFPSRTTFVIGMDGRILAIDRHVRTATHGADIAAALKGFPIPRQA